MMEKKLATRKIKHDGSIWDIMFSIVNYVGFFIFAIMCIYPFYYLLINTISANDLSNAGRIMAYPMGIHFTNYIEVFKLPGLGRATMVSLGRTVIGTTCSVVSSAFLGFMFSQQKMWLRRVWYRMLVATMYFNAGLIPMFMTMRNLHLTNNFLVYIIPVIVQPFNIILVKTYVESIPSSLQEAAEVDGAGILTIFAKIIFPTCTPILATITIFSAVGQWNAFQDTLIYITDQKLWSLQYLLYTYLNQARSLAMIMQNVSTEAIADLAKQQTATSIRMTVSVIVVLPILFVYPFFQRHFVKGIMIGSVKG